MGQIPRSTVRISSLLLLIIIIKFYYVMLSLCRPIIVWYLTVLLREIAFCSAIDSARLLLHISLQRGLSLCLSVVCHIRAPCLKCSTDSETFGRYTFWVCVRWSP